MADSRFSCSGVWAKMTLTQYPWTLCTHGYHFLIPARCRKCSFTKLLASYLGSYLVHLSLDNLAYTRTLSYAPIILCVLTSSESEALATAGFIYLVGICLDSERTSMMFTMHGYGGTIELVADVAHDQVLACSCLGTSRGVLGECTAALFSG